VKKTPRPPGRPVPPSRPAGHPAAPARAPRRAEPAAIESLLRRPVLGGAAVLAILTLVVFGDVLLSTSTVLSSKETDLFYQFVDWRTFGFTELARGNLALWNPYIYSGTPYFGGVQSALLYPPNWLYVVQPLASAINFGIALHVFLAGFFTYLWALYRKLDPVAGLAAAAMVMFGGAHFPHILAGHLSNLCTMAWAPLLFLAIDGLCMAPALGWALLAAFTVTMQILAGHPQYLFYTGVAAATYLVLSLRGARDRRWALLGFAGAYAGAVALAAIQLLPAIEVARDSIRVGGAYDWVASFSFPPENLLTLLAPAFFGDAHHGPYFGRWLSWEMTLFVGVTGVVLALHGALAARREARRAAGWMFAILLLLALGDYTPLLQVLYAAVPGFGYFRGNSKFIFFASVFLAMVAATGLDELLRTRAVARRLVPAVLAAGALLAVAAVVVYVSSTSAEGGLWWALLAAIDRTGEGNLQAALYASPQLVRQSGRLASVSVALAAATLLAVGGLLLRMRTHPAAVYGLAALAVLELTVYARTLRPTFELADTRTRGLARYLAQRPGDYRMFHYVNPNNGMSLGVSDIWGYDPSLSRRYAEFIAFTQNEPPDGTMQDVDFEHHDPLYRLLRCRYFIVPDPADARRFQAFEFQDLLPHLALVPQARVITGRDAVFAALRAPDFDPLRTVILEEDPVPAPAAAAAAPGTVTLVDASTDHLTIAAELSAPAILLVSDAYRTGWRATPLAGSIQREYQVLPADWVLRAIPLAAGSHRLRLEYLPALFVVGRWVSAAALALYLGLVWLVWRARPRAASAASPSAASGRQSSARTSVRGSR
jgi:hypothetical protein